jgi:hypothetical protein
MTQDAPSPLLLKEASCFDKQLRSTWQTMKAAHGSFRKASIVFGEICVKMQAKQLHKYVRNPDSRKGYISFEEYVDRLTDGEASKNVLYVSKQMYMLTQGENPIPAKVVAEMPQENIRLLSSIEEKDRTPEILKAVKSRHREFTKIVQGQINETLPPEKQKTPRIEFRREWHPDVVTKLEATIKRFHLLKGIVADGNYELTLDEKAVYAICNAAEAQCDDLLTAAESSAENEAIHIPETQEAAPAPAEAVEAKPAKKSVAKKKAKTDKTAKDFASDGTRIPHAQGCRCLMCKPPVVSTRRAQAAD